ncbi:glutamate-gated chloride channel [Trichonephila inaurata madagascariensis]|uniref:Glutamate-gated chloride channel n=1 Tax=Trichonephila inaurata madagascariensis TaxID=2747483 RepID=A0A8X6YUB2_9ARAC|nr:glutamate-gated chloride channel [Trichonephila inaurata madagascariensis]
MITEFGGLDRGIMLDLQANPHALRQKFNGSCDRDCCEKLYDKSEIWEYLFLGDNVLIVFILLNFVKRINTQNTSSVYNPRRLRIEDIVPVEYDGLRTPKIQNGPAEVKMTIVIMNVRNVDVSEMSVRFDLMMTKRWIDERLLFPVLSDEDKVVLDLEWRKRIWMPDIFFENSIEGHVQDMIIPNMYVWLFKNKTIQFTARISIEFSCHMDLRLFPHDTQECDMIIMSLAHTVDEMQLIWDKDSSIIQGEHIVLPQFEIIKISSGDCKKGNILFLAFSNGWYVL